MADPFVHRFGGQWSDDQGDRDITAPGVAESQPGAWSGSNLVRYRSGLLGPRPGMGWCDGVTSPANGKPAGFGLIRGEAFVSIIGSTTMYERSVGTSTTWTTTGTTTSYDEEFVLFDDFGDPLVARTSSGGTWRLADLDSWSTVIADGPDASNDPFGNVELRRAFDTNVELIGAYHDGRGYLAIAQTVDGQGSGLAYSSGDVTATWSGAVSIGPPNVPSVIRNLVTHDQGLFIQVDGSLWLLQGNPETGSLEQVVTNDVVLAIGGRGPALYALLVDGTIAEWNGSTLVPIADQFRSTIARSSFVSFPPCITVGVDTRNLMVFAGSGWDDVLIRHNGLWSRLNFPLLSTDIDTAPTATLARISPGHVRNAGTVIANTLLSGGGKFYEGYMAPARVDVSATDGIYLASFGFSSDNEPSTPAASSQRSLHDATVDINDASITVDFKTPARWATPGRQMQVHRVVACIERSGDTQTNNNELTLSLTTYDRRGGATPSVTESYAWTDAEDAQDVDFVVWDLVVGDQHVGDAYQVGVTNLVGCALRHLDVFGTELDADR